MSTRTQQSVMAWALQPASVAGMSFVRNFAATGAGSATTIVSTTLKTFASDDADFVGQWFSVTQAAAAQGFQGGSKLKRRITAYAYSTGTLTFDALPFATADGDQFTLLDSKDAPLVEDTGGSNITISDLVRSQADDFFNGTAEEGGPYVIVLESGSIPKSEVRRVANSTSSTGDLTLATSFSASTTVGDVFGILQFPEILEGGPILANLPRIDRASQTGTLGKPPQPAGNWEGAGAVTLGFRGPGASRPGGTSEAHTPFRCVMDVADVADCVVDSGASTSSVPCSSGAPAVGEMFMTEEGDVFIASAVSGTTITPSPTLRAVPSEGSTIYGAQQYTPTDGDLNYAMYIVQWLGLTTRHELFGCVPKITIAAAKDEWLKIALDFLAADGSITTLDSAGAALSRPWTAIRPSVDTRALGHQRVVVGSTELVSRTFNLDLGMDVQPHTNLAAPNSNDGHRLITDNVTGSVGVWNESDGRAAIQDYIQGREQAMLWQSGEGYGDPGTLALWATKTQYSGMENTDDTGLQAIDLPFIVTEDVSSALPRWSLAIF